VASLSDKHIFELKVDDGFRALAHVEAGQGELISRKFRRFSDLAAWIAEHLCVESAVLDGEVPVSRGRPSCLS